MQLCVSHSFNQVFPLIHSNIFSRIKNYLNPSDKIIGSILSANSLLVLAMRNLIFDYNESLNVSIDIPYTRNKKCSKKKEIIIEKKSSQKILKEFTELILKMLNQKPEYDLNLSSSQIIRFKSVFTNNVSHSKYSIPSQRCAKIKLKQWFKDYSHFGCGPLDHGIILRLGNWEFKSKRDDFRAFQKETDQILAQHHNISRYDLMMFVSTLTEYEIENIVDQIFNEFPELENLIKDHIIEKIQLVIGEKFYEEDAESIKYDMDQNIYAIVPGFDLLTIILQNISANYVIGPRLISGDTEQDTMLLISK